MEAEPAGRVQFPQSCYELGMYSLGVLRSCFLVVRFSSVIFVLHLLQILMSAGFYRWRCFPSWPMRSTSWHPVIRRSAMET